MKIVCYLALLLLGELFFTIAPHDQHPADQRTDKDVALFFAVSDYEEWPDLRNPIKDAEAIAKELEEHYNFTTEVIRNPSFKEISETLVLYRQKEYAEDAQLLVFFSGHGSYEDETKEGFFIPRDGQSEDLFQISYLPHGRLERAVTAIPCPHILLVIDACFSGTFDDALALDDGTVGQSTDQNIEISSFLDRALSYKSRLYLTSGGKERTPDGTEHSPFSENFLKALNDYGGENQILDFNELQSYLKYASPLPRAGSFEGHEAQGDFLFVFDPTTVAPDPIQDQALWQEVQQSNTIAAYQKYLRRFPHGQAREQAQASLEQLQAEKALQEDLLAWQRVRGINTKASYEEYLSSYPNGKFRGLAQKALSEISTSDDFVKRKPPQDPDGRIYNTVEMNGKIWLAENLKYPIEGGSWCYDDDENNCQELGRFYSFATAKEACSALGPGWRLPSYKDWLGIFDQGGPKENYEWLIQGGESDFSAILGGWWDDKGYIGKSYLGIYLTASVDTENKAYIVGFKSADTTVSRGSWPRDGRYNCRCVKDIEKLDPMAQALEKMPVNFPEGTVNGPSGKSYRTLEVDGKIWLKDNLAIKLKEGSWSYKNDENIAKGYGYLYTWEAAKEACRLLGPGWHLSTYEEWQALIDIYGDEEKSYHALIQPNGFAALLGGDGSWNDKPYFYGLSQKGHYWTAKEQPNDYAAYFLFHARNKELRVYKTANNEKLSCRCVKDSDYDNRPNKKEVVLEGLKRNPALPLPQDPAGKTYTVLEFGDKIWMRENLNYDIGDGSWCYQNTGENCQQYGRLYNWHAAIEACASLGDDWRLPTDKEWAALARYYGGYGIGLQTYDDPAESYKALMKTGPKNFSAMIGGRFVANNEYFVYLEKEGVYWSGAHFGNDIAVSFSFYSGERGRLWSTRNDKEDGLSCRCIKER